MKQIPSEQNRGWSVKIDGVPHTVGRIELESRYGKLTYGLRPEGYDSWIFKETGGGGAVTLPFTLMQDGTLLVGLIRENRPNMGGEVLCIIGGFVKVGETHAEAQAREAKEEAGLNSIEAEELAGIPICSNRLFFEADGSKGEGLRAYSMDIPEEFIVTDEDGTRRYAFPEEQREKFGKVGKVVLLPVEEAVRQTADALALAAIARLVADLF